MTKPRTSIIRLCLLQLFVVALLGVAQASPWTTSRHLASAGAGIRRGGSRLSSSASAAAAIMPYHGRRRPHQQLATIPNPLSLLKSLGRAYSTWLMDQPLRANMISGIVMVAMGDAISQAIEVDEKTGKKRCTSVRELSPRRLANAGFAGALFNGILLPQWYLLLHKVSPGQETAKTIAAKILSNCVAWGCVGNAAIMATRRLLDGDSWAKTERAIRRDLWDVMKNDYKIWPLYDVLCFTCIPRHMQGMSTGTLGILWATYLSFVTHTDEH